METKFGFAHKPMPYICPDCGKIMSAILRGREYDKSNIYRVISPSFVMSDTTWRKCECGCIIIWGCAFFDKLRYHQAFIRRHTLPMFDDKSVLEIVDYNG